MYFESFWKELERRIAPYDLLCHPYYQAWAAGTLTHDDLRAYAVQYYPHVAAFPGYLAALAEHLPQGPTRTAILMNRADELGEGVPDGRSHAGRSHAELWLDFAEGMGAERASAEAASPIAEINALTSHFQTTAQGGAVSEALAAFYAYESQVPRVAREKARGLKEMYGADEQTCRYFTLHTAADVHHAQVWRELIERQLATASADRVERTLQAAEDAARALCKALDGIERERQTRAELTRVS